MEDDLFVELSIGIAVQLAPFSQLLFPGFGTGRKLTVFQVIESNLVRGDHTATGTHFDRKVTDGKAFFHRGVADSFTGIFHEVTGSTARCHFTDDIKGEVFSRYAQLTFTVDGDAHRFRFALHNTLGSQCHFYLAGTDTEGDCTHCTVGRSMRVAANDRHTRLSQTGFRPYHMDDTVLRMLQTVISQVEILGILLQRIYLVF